MSALLRSLVDIVYPRNCSACDKTMGDDPGYVCWDCMSRIESIQHPFCAICGDPAEGAIDQEYVCSACKRYPPSYHIARSAIRYRGPARKLLRDFKFNCGLYLRNDLSKYLQACVEAHFDKISFDAVAPVPLFPSRERERSYNQAAVLAGNLATRLNVPFVSGCLKRIRSTDKQTELHARARRRNVLGAFSAERPDWIEGRVVLLIDDVMTTGATVGECSKMLKKAGAADVFVATVARG